MIIFNDLHLGCRRSGGTTPSSQAALRAYQFSSIRQVLAEVDDDHLMIAGDLFDSFTVDTRDWVDTYTLLAEWVGQGCKLTLVAGNHDVSSKGEKVSSFTALAKVLADSDPERVCVLDIGERGWVDHGVWAIAHHANQDQFELALNEALEIDGLRTLVLHCNFNNTFAQRTDHSLDLSAEMEKKFRDKGVQVLLAHEHNHRDVGCVKVLGCQFPTSISDCLENDVKYIHILSASKVINVIRRPCWKRKDSYADVDWRDLASAPDKQFIRVTGTAAASEAADVVNAIAKFRQKSQAFVVGNAVKVEGLIAADELPESFEAAKRFDVMNYISQHLDGEEMKVVNELLETQ